MRKTTSARPKWYLTALTSLTVLAMVMVACPTDAEALTAPTMTVGAVTSTTIALSWTDGGDETSYEVHRGTNPDCTGGSTLATLNANVLSTTLTNLTPNTLYRLQIWAKKGGQTKKSNCVTVTTGTMTTTTTTPPPPPPECSDGINNDPAEDTLIDYPADPGCTSATDTTELGNPPPPTTTTTVPPPPAVPEFGPTEGRDAVIAGAGPNPVSCPAPPFVEVTTAQNSTFNNILDSNAGATLCIRAGLYSRTGSLTPEANSTLVFETGAILDGGGADVAGIIINPTAPGVTIRGGEIRNYGTTQVGTSGRGVLISGANAVIEDVNIWDCFVTGVAIQAQASTLRRLSLHDNGIQGFGTGNTGPGQTDNLVIEYNEIYGNNTRLQSPGAEGGSSKILFSGNGVYRFNYSHDNMGFGPWWDTDNWNWIIEENVIENEYFSGLFLEANYGLIARRNFIRNNGKNIQVGTTVPSFSNTVNIRLSDNAANRVAPDGQVRPLEVYQNIVDNTVFPGGPSGRMILMWDHTDSASRHVSNNDVYHNQFWIRNTSQGQIRGRDNDVSPTGSTPTTDYQVWNLDNHFFDNEYHVLNTTTAYWMWGQGTETGDTSPLTYPQWQALGMDATGSIGLIP